MSLQPNKERVSIILDKEFKEELRAEAKKENRSLSSYIAYLLAKIKKK